ncbi:MAG: ShlB/FhaC/HecB family hemolysin secretion/activation protein [Caulobacteraceae bacterium]
MSTPSPAGFSGDHHDNLGGGGWDQFWLGYTVGDLDIRTPSARLFDRGTARANGEYGKLSFSASRLQTVAGPFSLYALVRGQVATKNLDISEKMELGGAYAVRAYPEGEIYGDDGYVATVEGRVLLPPMPAPIPGRAQLIAFVDWGFDLGQSRSVVPRPQPPDRQRRGRRGQLGCGQQPSWSRSATPTPLATPGAYRDPSHPAASGSSSRSSSDVGVSEDRTVRRTRI